MAQNTKPLPIPCIWTGPHAHANSRHFTQRKQNKFVRLLDNSQWRHLVLHFRQLLGFLQVQQQGNQPQRLLRHAHLLLGAAAHLPALNHLLLRPNFDFLIPVLIY